MVDLAEIKQEHNRLYNQYRDQSTVLAHLEDFVEEAGRLIEKIELCSAEVKCREDYEWLRAAAEDWRSIFVSGLNIPKDVRLAEPRAPLSDAAPKQRMKWADDGLEQWVRNRAYELAKERAVRRKHKLTSDELLWHMPSTPDEQNGDWETANGLLICEILDGTMHLTQLVL